MMVNKERLATLVDQIKRLKTIAEEMQERELYPVSFFSQAYDMTNRIQEELRQIEGFQIEMIETQMKAQREQIVEQQPLLFTQQEMEKPEITQPVPKVHINVSAAYSAPPDPQAQEPAKPTPFPPTQEAPKAPPSYSLTVESNRIDLKRMITLNDRFLFCRELFAGDENLMNQTISDLNREKSYETSIGYLQKRFEWNFDDEKVIDFLAVLKKRFA